MHRNPVKNGLVQQPEQWAWSTYRRCACDEEGMVRINQWPAAELNVSLSGMSGPDSADTSESAVNVYLSRK